MYIRKNRYLGSRCNCEIFGPIDGPDIADDINNPKVIGAADFVPAEDSSARAGSLLGFNQIVPVIVAAAAGALLGVGL